MSHDRHYTRKSGAVSILRREPIPREELRALVPSVFAQAPMDTVSDGYRHLPTIDVVDRFEKEGFKVYGAAQAGSTSRDSVQFMQHQLRLRSTDKKLAVGDSFAEIILTNSHDRSSSWRLGAGLFRLACTNGMVVSLANVLQQVRLRHMESSEGQLKMMVHNTIEAFLLTLPSVTKVVGSMERAQLSAPQRLKFATDALRLKYAEDSIPMRASQLLSVERETDSKPTLWNTFNTVQEHLLYGGQQYVHEAGKKTRRMETKPVITINEQNRLNLALWQMAEKYIVA